jgi:hypothetical protein
MPNAKRFQQLSRNVFKITIPIVVRKDWESWVLLTSDQHWDNPKSNHKLQLKHLEEAKERDASIISAGDFFCAMQGKYDRRANKTALRPEHRSDDYFDSLIETASNFFAPYAHNFFLIGMGNHEASIVDRHETNLIERLVAVLNNKTKSKIFSGGFSGWIIFTFMRHDNKQCGSIVLHYDHGYGGGGPVTADMIQHQRRSVYLPDADIILSGHCFSEDTEILTPEGWKFHQEITEHSCVATMNKTNKTLEWQQVNSIFKYDHFKEMHSFENSKVNLLVTSEHGMIFEKYRDKELVELPAKDTNKIPELCWLHGALDTIPDFNICDDTLRLLTWIVADGCIEDGGIRFHFSKQRKINKIKKLCASLDIPFTSHVQNTGNTKIRIGVAYATSFIDLLEGVKELPTSFIKNLSGRQAQIVLEEYRLSDGQFENSVISWQLYSFNKQNINVLQALAVKAGFRGLCSNETILNICPKHTSFEARIESRVVPYSGIAWCVSVPNGTLIVRRKGKAVITQNTHDSWMREIARIRLTQHGGLKQDVQTHLKLPSYKDDYVDGHGGWAVTKGFPPKPLGAYWLKFSYDVKESRVVYQIVKA